MLWKGEVSVSLLFERGDFNRLSPNLYFHCKGLVPSAAAVIDCPGNLLRRCSLVRTSRCLRFPSFQWSRINLAKDHTLYLWPLTESSAAVGEDPLFGIASPKSIIGMFFLTSSSRRNLITSSILLSCFLYTQPALVASFTNWLVESTLR